MFTGNAAPAADRETRLYYFTDRPYAYGNNNSNNNDRDIVVTITINV